MSIKSLDQAVHFVLGGEFITSAEAVRSAFGKAGHLGEDSEAFREQAREWVRDSYVPEFTQAARRLIDEDKVRLWGRPWQRGDGSEPREIIPDELRMLPEVRMVVGANEIFEFRLGGARYYDVIALEQEVRAAFAPQGAADMPKSNPPQGAPLKARAPEIVLAFLDKSTPPRRNGRVNVIALSRLIAPQLDGADPETIRRAISPLVRAWEEKNRGGGESAQTRIWEPE